MGSRVDRDRMIEVSEREGWNCLLAHRCSCKISDERSDLTDGLKTEDATENATENARWGSRRNELV